MNEPAPFTGLLERESEIVRVLADAATIDDASHRILAALATWGEWDVALLWVPDDELGLLRCASSWSAGEPRLVEFRHVNERLTFARDVGLPGRVWSAAQPHWIGKVGDDIDFPRAGVAARAGLQSATAIPIIGSGGVLGVIELVSTAVRLPDADHAQLLSTVGRQLAHYVARVRTEERLRESEERASAIFEAALDCVITMDHHGSVVDFNPAAEATFGYSRDEAVGRPLVELIVPQSLRDKHRAGLRRYLATREPEILNRRLELEGCRADGTTFPVELTITRIGRSEPPLFAGFLRDITERHQADDDRRRLVKEAVASRAREEAARVRAEFAQHEAESERARLEFLAYVGIRMAASMDYTTTLEEVARAAVPAIADLCVVTVSSRTAVPSRLRSCTPTRSASGSTRAASPGIGDVRSVARRCRGDRAPRVELLPESTTTCWSRPRATTST